ncbi:hypothetical protein GALMADRAFT_253279 [Galerina marginata CBS 339.88]|uniref:Ketoreductase domain-containing protein n=1 Tax=Galerina marginata (strain CBS 339.88) TaxID=685588 RepID=A0A067SM38_GALM3|nr:hypothetical protein GALMADRAFT_253279 [Galerina marginata CBS 339.88]
MKIENRTFIVSGGSSGLGLATVQLLLFKGANLAIIDRSPPPESVLSSSHVAFYKTDITKLPELTTAVDSAASWATSTGTPLGGVINCAGVAPAASTIDRRGKAHSLEVWDSVIAINLTGSFNLTRLVLEHLVKVEPEDGEDGERGVVVLVSSSAAYEGPPGTAAYSATKGAIRSLTLPMARDLARHAVRVVSIAPGPFSSPLTSVINDTNRKSMLDNGILYPQRFGRPEEFARTVEWILECPYVNGESIRLSAGGRLPARL